MLEEKNFINYYVNMINNSFSKRDWKNCVLWYEEGISKGIIKDDIKKKVQNIVSESYYQLAKVERFNNNWDLVKKYIVEAQKLDIHNPIYNKIILLLSKKKNYIYNGKEYAWESYGKKCKECGHTKIGFMDCVCCRGLEYKSIENQLNPEIDKTYSVVKYRPLNDPECKDEISELIRILKGTKDKNVGILIGKVLVEYIYKNKGLFLDIDCAIPVPYTRTTLAERGEMPTNRLCEAFEACACIPVFEDILYKIKETKNFRKLRYRERKAEIQNAFDIANYEKISNKNVMIIDDVMTTGSTLRECGRTLRNANPKTITVLTVAKTERSI